MSGLRDNLDRAWGQVQTGWNHLVQRASDALTRFTSSDSEDEDTRTLLRLSPDWGLLAAEVRETRQDIRVRLEVPAGGMQLPAWLEPTMDDRRIAEAARECEVSISPFASFFLAQPLRPGLYLGYAGVPDDDVAPALSVLARILDAA